MSLTLLLNDAADDLLKAWPSKPRVYHRGITELDHNVPLSLMDRYIDYDLVPANLVRASRDGKAVHPGRYSRDGALRPGEVRKLFQEGYTILLREIQRSVPYLAEVTRAIQRQTGYPPYVTAIITPPGHVGLKHHWDQCMFLIAQLHGRKRWPLWCPAVERPMGDHHESPRMWTPELQRQWDTSPPDMEAELAPGDTLILPRGWVHSPYAVGGETSYHLTFAIRERTWLWLAQQLIAQAIEEPDFRAEVPPSSMTGDVETAVRTARTMVSGFLDRLDSSAAAASVRAAARDAEA